MDYGLISGLQAMIGFLKVVYGALLIQKTNIVIGIWI